MRCLQLEEQWRQAQSGFGSRTIGGFARASKLLLRGVLRLSGWTADAVLGRVKTIGSIAEYAAYCDDADLVSFDVFDTLFYRTVEPPDVLKRRFANYAAHVLASYGLPVHRDLFLHVRSREEARLRRRALASGSDSECKLSELIHATVKSLCGTEIADRETDALVQYEIDVECQHLRVAPGVLDLLSSLQTNGKRIVAISDTYLETRHLELIFKNFGIERYFSAIFASADHSIGKYSGRLFEAVIQLQRTKPERMVHVGDNYGSDVRAAIRAGVHAVFLRDKDALRRRRQTGCLTSALFNGRLTLESCSRIPAPSDHRYEGENLDLFLIGRDILGPAFTAFVLRVIEECYRWNVSDVYFLAREGYLLQKIYDLLVRGIYRFRHLPPIPVHYLYVSRLGTSLPALDGTQKRILSLARFRNRDAGLHESLRAFGLTLADVTDLPLFIESESLEAASQLFADPEFMTRLQDLANRGRQLLKNYLVQEGFFDREKVKALVDIGWNATIQANLTRAFYCDPDFPTIIGLYFGRRYAHEDDYALSSRSFFSPGLMFDERRLVEAEHAVDRCIEMFEISASAPHGVTLSYRDEGGVVKPVLQDSALRLTREQEILQAGILTHTDAFAKAYNDYEVDTEILLNQAARRLRRFICRPTYQEVRALSGVRHATDWGSQVFRPLIATELCRASVFSPSRSLASLRHCCWPEGSLRHSRIPGGLFLFSMLRWSLRSRQNLRKLASFCGNFLRGSTIATPPTLMSKEEVVSSGDNG